ncbi:DUF7833 domain-containing protein [Sphingobacterium kyonggiense]
MSDKLGFTFYPKDWWTSDSFFELSLVQRYLYLETLFVMYSNGGFMKTQKTQLENRMRTQITDEDWQIVTERFVLIEGKFTHPSVNKRLRRTTANRENGKKGGRPPKNTTKTGENTLSEKPKKPNLETQNNPPLEIEREREREIKENIYSVPISSVENKNQENENPKNPWDQYSPLDYTTPRSDLLCDLEFITRIGNNQVISNEQTISWINKFFDSIETTKESHTTLQAYRKHCMNWINSKITNQKKYENNQTSTRRHEASRPSNGYGKL